MDGVEVLRAVLVGNFNLTSLVAADRIAAGVLPPNTELPAIEIKKVSGVDRNIPLPGQKRAVRERVQVMAMADTYPHMKDIIKASRSAAADKIIPAIAGVESVTIHTDLGGPDFMNEEASIYISTQDFIVAYTELR
jgi:hypothetical protein